MYIDLTAAKAGTDMSKTTTKKSINRDRVREQQFNFSQMGKRVIVVTSQFFYQVQKGYQEVARWYRQVGHLMLDRTSS